MKNIEIRENEVKFEENGVRRTIGTEEYDGTVTEDNVEDVIQELTGDSA